MNFDNRILKLKSKTWSRDSYGLFDFETTNYFSHNLNIRSPGIIVRDGNEIHFVPETSKLATKTGVNANPMEILAVVTIEDGSITVKPSNNNLPVEDINKKLWQVVKDCEDRSGYLLKCNDIIKLGRVIFKIKEIKFNGEKNDKTNSNYQKSIIESIKQHFENITQNDQKSKQVIDIDRINVKSSMSSICRICLGDNNEAEDPFISPCMCIGSLKYIHLSCLQKWVKTKLNIQENKNLITIFWKNLDCELCKTQFPFNVRQGGQDYSIIPIDTRNIGSYLVMESLSKDKHPTGIHIIDISGTNKIGFGRGHDCDLKITDISVSRMHAALKMNKGRIYLQDNNSKFGTLVLRKMETVFDENLRETSLQCGRTVLKFSIKRPWFTYVPCLGTRITNPPTSALAFKTARTKTMAGDELDLQDQDNPAEKVDTV